MRVSFLVALCLAACGYPDADEVFGEGNTPSSPTSSATGAGAGAGSGTTGAGAAQGSGAASGSATGGATATVAGSGGGGSGAGEGGGGAAPSCDADADGHDAIGACGGDDCDDESADAHPGQGAFFPAARADGSYDWNCDGDEETETPKVTCEGGLGCGFAQGDTGFEQEVACGAVAEVGSCDGIPCSFDGSAEVTQRCR